MKIRSMLFAEYFHGDPTTQRPMHQGVWSADEIFGFENEYVSKVDVRCMVPGCNQAHNKGYTARHKSGSLVLIGNKCGRTFLRDTKFQKLNVALKERKRNERLTHYFNNGHFSPIGLSREIDLWFPNILSVYKTHTLLRQFDPRSFDALLSTCRRNNGELKVETTVRDYAREASESLTEGNEQRTRFRQEWKIVHRVAGRQFIENGGAISARFHESRENLMQVVNLISKPALSNSEMLQVEKLLKKTYATLAGIIETTKAYDAFIEIDNLKPISVWMNKHCQSGVAIRKATDGSWFADFGDKRRIPLNSIPVPDARHLQKIALDDELEMSA